MLPVVSLDGNAIDSDLINKVRTYREFNRPDMAIISVIGSSGSVPYNIGQDVQIDLTSRGGTIFTGKLVGVEPTDKSNLTLRAKTKEFRIPTTTSPDSIFRDTISDFTYSQRSDESGKGTVGILEVRVKQSIEYDRVLYELSWAKDIRSPQFD